MMATAPIVCRSIVTKACAAFTTKRWRGRLKARWRPLGPIRLIMVGIACGRAWPHRRPKTALKSAISCVRRATNRCRWCAATLGMASFSAITSAPGWACNDAILRVTIKRASRAQKPVRHSRELFHDNVRWSADRD